MPDSRSEYANIDAVWFKLDVDPLTKVSASDVELTVRLEGQDVVIYGSRLDIANRLERVVHWLRADERKA